jgi:probable F420-dependent oxidoreductase
MTGKRPFRFGVQGRATATGAEWIAKARKAEDLGYDTFLVPDHFPRGLGPVAALAVAATATTRLRVGTFVFDNDFRHPVVLAKEVATLDMLSGGRFELGIGAGWFREEYEQAGMPFDPPGVRIRRLEESIQVLKSLFTGESVHFSGAFYTLNGLATVPRPAQQPHPPILIGGGSRRILSLAARMGDIIGLGPQARADGTIDPLSVSEAATRQKLAWIREANPAADTRELNIFVYGVTETDNPRAVAEPIAAELELPVDDLLNSPHFLFGSVDNMVETLEARREEYNLSYIVVPEDQIDHLAPLIARLAGK